MSLRPRRASFDLAKSLPNLSALLKSRGMDLRDMARRQPDLLLQNPGTIRMKLDAMPGALLGGRRGPNVSWRSGGGQANLLLRVLTVLPFPLT